MSLLPFELLARQLYSASSSSETFFIINDLSSDNDILSSLESKFISWVVLYHDIVGVGYPEALQGSSRVSP